MIEAVVSNTLRIFNDDSTRRVFHSTSERRHSARPVRCFRAASAFRSHC